MFKKIFGAIFGSPANTEKVIDGAKNGLDKLFYTDEEKADAAKEVREWFIEYLKATQPQNLARRFIAITVTLLWGFLILTGVAAFSVEVMLGTSEAVIALFIFKVLTDIVAIPFAGLMAFYFLTHTLRATKKD